MRFPEEYGGVLNEASGDIWNVSIDKAKTEAYEKIEMMPKGEGAVADGVMQRWFTEVTGLGLAEQASRFKYPD